MTTTTTASTGLFPFPSPPLSLSPALPSRVEAWNSKANIFPRRQERASAVYSAHSNDDRSTEFRTGWTFPETISFILGLVLDRKERKGKIRGARVT